MISDSPFVTVDALARETGWQVKPEGACLDRPDDQRCVPLPAHARQGEKVDLRVLAERLGMPLLSDEVAGVWALGPESGGRALASAHVPDLVLATLGGEPWALSQLRGRKVLIAAWASW